MHSRRLFLKSSALAIFGVGVAPAWLSRAVYAADGPARRKKILIAVFQRGAVDGLNMVVPHGDKRYYEMRPTIAIPRPDGTPDSAIDLDGMFGLHPSLAPLVELLLDGRVIALAKLSLSTATIGLRITEIPQPITTRLFGRSNEGL